MKIQELSIRNFRGIREVGMSNLGDMVIIAGQNGSGKSCIFDAVRLLKSAYGGYQANEWHHWMGEFQINLSSRSSDFQPIFNDSTKPLHIACDFKLSDAECGFIKENADELLREKIWRTILPEAYGWGGPQFARFAAQFRDREPEVARRAAEEKPILIDEITKQKARGKLEIRPGSFPSFTRSIALEVIFSNFRPSEMGVIDYHGAQRHYGRENVQGINLNLDANEQQRSQSALYNYASKYNNVKGEMAASYVKEILAEQAGVPKASQSTLTRTLTELFQTFFPEKQFFGPRPTLDGLLKFPVVTQNGSSHDLDDLSSGEKEVLYGYLRIRNSAPRFSIILLDEPELHLNPRLIRALPAFYKKHLGQELDNQIWLITHSDALLREVVGRNGYDVFHMLPSGSLPDGESQLKSLRADRDLELALIDLVGDLASYRPGGKVVILEGGGDSEFDLKAVSALFPEIAESVNLISGSNKARVKALHETLKAAEDKGSLPFQFYCITDLDSDPPSTANATRSFQWDAYHIENYLIDGKYIARTLETLKLHGEQEEQIWVQLRQCAEESIPSLVRHELSEHVNVQLLGAIRVGGAPAAPNAASALAESISASTNRINALANNELKRESLEAHEAKIRERFEAELANGGWIRTFRGRDVLRRFAGKHCAGTSYEVFRNVLLSKMKDDGFKPKGMKAVIDGVIGA